MIDLNELQRLAEPILYLMVSPEGRPKFFSDGSLVVARNPRPGYESDYAEGCRDLELTALPRDTAKKLIAAAKVLPLALMALEHCRSWIGDEEPLPAPACEADSAMTALRTALEELK